MGRRLWHISVVQSCVRVHRSATVAASVQLCFASCRKLHRSDSVSTFQKQLNETSQVWRLLKLYALANNGLRITALLHRLVHRNFQRRRTVVSGVDDQWQADLIDLPNANMLNDSTRSCWLLLKCFPCMSWVAEEQNRQVYSQSLCKILKQKWTEEDIVFCKRTVVSSSPTNSFKIHFFRYKITKQNLPLQSEWSEHFCFESGDTSHSKTAKDTSTCFQIFTILYCNISSQRKTKWSQMAIT